MRACLQLQDTQLKRLQLETRRVAPAPEKEAVQVGRVPRPGGSASPEPEPHSAQAQHPDNPRGRAPRPRLHSARVSASQLPGPQQQNQMQALDKRYPPVPPTHRTGLGEGEGLWGSSHCCPASVGPSPGLWFPPMWRLLGLANPSTAPLQKAWLLEPGSPGRGLRLGQAPTLKAAQPAPGHWEGPQAGVPLVCQAGGSPGGPNPDPEEAGTPGLRAEGR